MIYYLGYMKLAIKERKKEKKKITKASLLSEGILQAEGFNQVHLSRVL